jgi:hypothetical protein
VLGICDWAGLLSMQQLQNILRRDLFSFANVLYFCVENSREIRALVSTLT